MVVCSISSRSNSTCIRDDDDPSPAATSVVSSTVPVDGDSIAPSAVPVDGNSVAAAAPSTDGDSVALPALARAGAGDAGAALKQLLQLLPAVPSEGDSDFAELFAGEAAVSTGLRFFNFKGESLDLRQTPPCDFMRPEGFMQVLAAIWRLRAGGLFWAAPASSSWVWMSRWRTHRTSCRNCHSGGGPAAAVGGRWPGVCGGSGSGRAGVHGSTEEEGVWGGWGGAGERGWGFGGGWGWTGRRGGGWRGGGDRAAVGRRNLCIRGNPNSAYVQGQNALVSRLLLLLELCVRRDLFFIIEQPCTSKMFEYPPLGGIPAEAWEKHP